MKRLPIVFIAVLLLTLFVVGCSNLPAPPAAQPGDQEAVDVAVEATLTAIAESDSAKSVSTPAPVPDPTSTEEEVKPDSVSTPDAPEEVSPSGLVLPPSITDFDPVARPASSKGDPDAPVVIYEWSDYT